MRKLHFFVLITVALACEDPNAGRERWVTEDGRVAIGKRPVIERTPIPGFEPASEVRRSGRYYLSFCEDVSQADPAALPLYTDPDLTGEASNIDSGYCVAEPVLVWAVAPHTSATDAIRIELLSSGRMGWVSRNAIGPPLEAGDCDHLFGTNRERLARCRYGPPIWESVDWDTVDVPPLPT